MIYDDVTWNILTIQNGSGIPDNSINGIAEDSVGNLWLATAANGIVVYRANGVGWFWYYMGSTNIPTNSLTCILIDSLQQAWTGSMDKGLIKRTGIFFSYYGTLNSGMPDDFIQCFFLDHAGIFWLGTKTQGLVRFDESLLTGLENNFPAVALSVFPNPAADFFDVDTHGRPVEKIILFDITGKEIPVIPEKISIGHFRITLPKTAPDLLDRNNSERRKNDCTKDFYKNIVRPATSISEKIGDFTALAFRCDKVYTAIRLPFTGSKQFTVYLFEPCSAFFNFKIFLHMFTRR